MSLVQQYGTKWSKIVKFLPGRTDNAIKNRWNSTMRKNMRRQLKEAGVDPQALPKAASLAKVEPFAGLDAFSAGKTNGIQGVPVDTTPVASALPTNAPAVNTPVVDTPPVNAPTLNVPAVTSPAATPTVPAPAATANVAPSPIVILPPTATTCTTIAAALRPQARRQRQRLRLRLRLRLPARRQLQLRPRSHLWALRPRLRPLVPRQLLLLQSLRRRRLPRLPRLRFLLLHSQLHHRRRSGPHLKRLQAPPLRLSRPLLQRQRLRLAIRCPRLVQAARRNRHLDVPTTLLGQRRHLRHPSCHRGHCRPRLCNRHACQPRALPRHGRRACGSATRYQPAPYTVWFRPCRPCQPPRLSIQRCMQYRLYLPSPLQILW